MATETAKLLPAQTGQTIKDAVRTLPKGKNVPLLGSKDELFQKFAEYTAAAKSSPKPGSASCMNCLTAPESSCD